MRGASIRQLRDEAGNRQDSDAERAHNTVFLANARIINKLMDMKRDAIDEACVRGQHDAGLL